MQIVKLLEQQVTELDDAAFGRFRAWLMDLDHLDLSTAQQRRDNRR